MKATLKRMFWDIFMQRRNRTKDIFIMMLKEFTWILTIFALNRLRDDLAGESSLNMNIPFTFIIMKLEL